MKIEKQKELEKACVVTGKTNEDNKFLMRCFGGGASFSNRLEIIKLLADSLENENGIMSQTFCEEE